MLYEKSFSTLKVKVGFVWDYSPQGEKKSDTNQIVKLLQFQKILSY